VEHMKLNYHNALVLVFPTKVILKNHDLCRKKEETLNLTSTTRNGIVNRIREELMSEESNDEFCF